MTLANILSNRALGLDLKYEYLHRLHFERCGSWKPAKRLFATPTSIVSKRPLRTESAETSK